METYIFIHLASVFFFLLISIFNLFTAPRINVYHKSQKNIIKNLLSIFQNSKTGRLIKPGIKDITEKIYELPTKISVLIPARNEEDNISKCLDSILKQNHKNLEIIVYDDNSTDNTPLILKNYSENFSFIKTIKGEKVPEGWTGKNWACYNLAKSSQGDLIVFMDADVIIKEGTLDFVEKQFRNKNIVMMSCFPTQIMKSPGEYLVVPNMNWILLTFLPLVWVYRSKHPSFVSANGQFIAFKKDIYFKYDGHSAVKNDLVEDMALARLLKRKREKIITFVGSNGIFCRMYHDFKGAVSGFSKNFYTGFKTSYTKFSLFLLFIAFIFLGPFVLVFLNTNFLYVIILILVQKLLVSINSSQNVLVNLFLTPVHFLMIIYLGIVSMYKYHKREIEWKGRKITFDN